MLIIMLMPVHLSLNMEDTHLLTHLLTAIQQPHRLRSLVVVLLSLVQDKEGTDSPCLEVMHLPSLVDLPLSLVAVIKVITAAAVDTLLDLLTARDMEDSLVVLVVLEEVLARSGSPELIRILLEVRHRLNSRAVIILLIRMEVVVGGKKLEKSACLRGVVI
jgi:hypothetical protein